MNLTVSEILIKLYATADFNSNATVLKQLGETVEREGVAEPENAIKEAEHQLNELIREARIDEWRAILGVDFDKFYPEDTVHDFIELSSQWINQQISEINMVITRPEHLKETEVKDEN